MFGNEDAYKIFYSIHKKMSEKIYGFFLNIQQSIQRFSFSTGHIPNARLTPQIFNPDTWERLVRVISCDSQKMSPVYQLLFVKHTTTIQNHLFFFINCRQIICSNTILLKDISQEHQSFHSIGTISVPTNADTYLGTNC